MSPAVYNQEAQVWAEIALLLCLSLNLVEWKTKSVLIYGYISFHAGTAFTQPWRPAAEVWAVMMGLIFLWSSWTLKEGTWKKKVLLLQEWRFMLLLMPDIGVALLVRDTNNLGEKLQQSGKENRMASWSKAGWVGEKRSVKCQPKVERCWGKASRFKLWSDICIDWLCDKTLP